MMYALVAVLGIVIAFWVVCFTQGFLISLEEELRDIFGLRPRHRSSVNANRWVWENGKAIRKATFEEQKRYNI